MLIIFGTHSGVGLSFKMQA